MKKITMMRHTYQKVFVGLALSLFILGFSYDSEAEIFKCAKVDGSIVYHDKPCSKIDKETKIKSVKDPVNGYIAPTTFVEEKEIVNRKFVVIGEDESTVSNSASLEPNSKSETMGNQNSGSQIDNSTDVTSKDNSNSVSRKHKGEEGIALTKEEILQKKGIH